MSRLGLGQRILLVFTGLVLVGSAALILWSGSRLQAATLDFFRQDLLNRVITAASSIGVGGEEGEGRFSAAALQSRLAGLSEDTGYDFLLVDGSGRLLVPQSAPDYLSILPVSLFQSAVQSGSGVYTAPDASGQERAWAVVPLLKEEGNPGFLIVSAPTAAADAEVRAQWLTLLAIALPIVALVALASVWVARSIIRPLHQVEELALRMADGHLDTRITVHASHEINALAAAFNQMAAQLGSVDRPAAQLRQQRRPRTAPPADGSAPAPRSGRERRSDPEQQRAYLKELDAETARMAELVTSLLTLGPAG